MNVERKTVEPAGIDLPSGNGFGVNLYGSEGS